MKSSISSQIKLDSSQLTVAFQKWGNGKEILIALHGWLDNSASFSLMGAFLPEKYTLYALDLPGHGHSEPLPPCADYTMVSGVQTLLDFAKTMGIRSFHLMGHSMGAGIATLAAGTVPKKIKSLTLIEGLGPLSSERKEFPKKILKNFKIKFRKLVTEKPEYKSQEEAALDRSQKSGLEIESSRLLAERGTVKKENGYFTWRTDTRLLVPTAHPLTEEDIFVFLEEIRSPCTLIVGSQSPLKDHPSFKERIKKVKGLDLRLLEGGHHVHMEVPESVIEALL